MFKTFACRACCTAVPCARRVTVRSSKALMRPPPGRCRELSRSCATGAFSASSPSGRSRRSRRARLCAMAPSGQGAPSCPIRIKSMTICSRYPAPTRSPARSGRARRPAVRASWRRRIASLTSRMPPWDLPARWPSFATEDSPSGRIRRGYSRCASTSPSLCRSNPRPFVASSPREPVVMAATVMMTSRSTQRCSPAPFLAGRCGCNGCATTSLPGSLTARPW